MESLPNKASEIFNSIIQGGPRAVPLKSGAVLKVELQERIAQGVVWSLAHYAKGDDKHDPKVLFYIVSLNPSFSEQKDPNRYELSHPCRGVRVGVSVTVLLLDLCVPGDGQTRRSGDGQAHEGADCDDSSIA